MILEPGMDVECIDGYGLVKTGEKYVIERCFPDFDAVSLVGVIPSDPMDALLYHGTYASRRFRPIKKKKTDIGVLQQLTKIRETEEV